MRIKTKVTTIDSISKVTRAAKLERCCIILEDTKLEVKNAKLKLNFQQINLIILKLKSNIMLKLYLRKSILLNTK